MFPFEARKGFSNNIDLHTITELPAPAVSRFGVPVLDHKRYTGTQITMIEVPI
jgi:K+-transporting ATPase A subunit